MGVCDGAGLNHEGRTMPSASRTRDLDDLQFVDVAPHKEGKDVEPGTRVTSREIEEIIFPDADYNAIAKELGTTRDRVSYVIHAKPDRRGRINDYVLTGTFGEGEAYDPAQDPRAAFRMTQDLLRQGAGAVGGAGKK
jgi:hypothetical protein